MSYFWQCCGRCAISCAVIVTAQYELFGRVLRCTFTVQEQLQVGVGYWAM